MLNEKFNNSWKSELDLLSSLPGEPGQDMNTVWEKLGTRLQKKQSNKKYILYWLAAACICGCIMIASIFLTYKKENTFIDTAKNIRPEGKKEIVQSPVENELKLIASIPTVKKNKVPVQPRVKNPVAGSKTIMPVFSPVAEIIPEKKDSLIITSTVPQTIKPRPIVFTLLKKKLPMVHINELEKPVQPIEALAGNNDRPTFRVRIFSRDIQPGSTGINNENNNVLKIKLSPQY